ncbi:MAG: hypothetical protein KKD39_05695, partial [Candidatus Altiarchaeota archaeon]|nr:hypothetical protein [Candidatus Altiarchaeota archaeon]
MKVALISPFDIHTYPLNLGYLASSICEEHDVIIFDLALIQDEERLHKKIKEFNPDIAGFTTNTPYIKKTLEHIRV